MKRNVLALCALVLVLGLAHSQPAYPQPPSPFSTQQIREGVYIVRFSNPAFNMNNLVLADPAGVVLVDTLPTLPTLTPPWALFYPFRAVIHTLVGSRPIDTLVNTSWHFDHVGLNNLFRDNEGTQRIVAHWRVGPYLAEPHCNPDFSPPFCTPAYPLPESQPTDGVHGEARLKLQNETVVLKTVENAHSNADLFVHLERANVVYTGDVYFGGIYPIIDRPAGGTLNGTLAALLKILDLIDDDTVVVPSHGAVGNREAVLSFIEMLEGYRWQIRQLIARGFTEEEVMYDPSFDEVDQQWQGPFIDGPTFRRVLYRDLASQKVK